MATSCNTNDKISRLERETEQLKAEVNKNNAAIDYDLQAKFAHDARGWFNDHWSRDKDTTLLDYTNHYSKASNKCFILVEYHYSTDRNGSWINDMTLWDVYENSKYGDFSETHTISFQPTLGSHDHIIICELLGDKCKTGEQFNEFVRPYLSN
jgi:hypothetical protein